MPNTVTTGPSEAQKPDDEDDGLAQNATSDHVDNTDSRVAGKQSTKTTPARNRKMEPPPMPRRADFGDHYPDGGWGWVVCAAASLVHFLALGTHLAFGTLLTIVLAKFKTSLLATGR